MRLGHLSRQATDAELVEFARKRMRMMGLDPASYRITHDRESEEVNAELRADAEIEIERR